jgi:hypothetical protein
MFGSLPRISFLKVLLIFAFTLYSVMPQTWALAEKLKIYQGGQQPGHYLQWNGKPILLIGDSVTQGWMETGVNFDHRAYIDALASRGINLLMLWSYIGTDAARQQKDPRIGYNAPEIWPWTGSADNKDFDLTKFNQSYFDLLKDLVAYAEAKGVVILISVHDGWTKRRFDRHPYNALLGNGPLTDKRQYVSLSDYNREMPTAFNPSWGLKQKNQYFQERFCHKLISELNPYSNVIYEMFNEGDWYDGDLRNRHEQHFLTFFRARCNNLLLTNTDHISGDDPHNDKNVDLITLHGSWTGRFADFHRGFNTLPPKPYLMSEPVPNFDGDTTVLDSLRRMLWEVTLAGGGWVNQNDTSFGWDPNTAMAAKAFARNLAYEYVGHCSHFFNRSGVNFSNMSPARNLSSTDICMANPGVEYLIYAPSGGSFKVDLSAATGTLPALLFNPRTGEALSAGSVRGGGIQTITSPDTKDWVLHIGERAIPPANR